MTILFKTLLILLTDVIANFTQHLYSCLGARGVIVIVVGNEHGDTSSKPGRD